MEYRLTSYRIADRSQHNQIWGRRRIGIGLIGAGRDGKGDGQAIRRRAALPVTEMHNCIGPPPIERPRQTLFFAGKTESFIQREQHLPDQLEG